MTQKTAKSRAIARRRAELAAKGVYECMGACRKTKPLAEGIVVTWGNNVMLAICPECFPATPILMRRTEQGVAVEVADKSAWQSPLIIARDLSDVAKFVSQEALPKFKKVSME